MTEIGKILANNIGLIVLFIGAIILALQGHDYWGWFLFCGVLLYCAKNLN